MRVLLVNEFFQRGGAENVLHSEARILKKFGHEVHIVTFDPLLKELQDDECINVRYPMGSYFGAVPIMLQRCLMGQSLTDMLRDIKPDVIHAHNLFGAMRIVCNAIAAYKEENSKLRTIQTLHDCGVICPWRGWCLRRDCSLCSEPAATKCLACGKSLATLIKLIRRHVYSNLREATFKTIISPSRALADMYTSIFKTEVKVIRNPVQLWQSTGDAQTRDFNRFLYLGGICEHKGFNQLMRSWELFHGDNSQSVLTIAGPSFNGRDTNINDVLCDEQGIEYLGVLTHNQVMREYARAGTVVIPSLWAENYPTVALEAQAAGALVMGSNRGGVPEAMGAEGIVFDVLDSTSFVAAFESAANMSVDERRQRVESAQRRQAQENSDEAFYQALAATW